MKCLKLKTPKCSSTDISKTALKWMIRRVMKEEDSGRSSPHFDLRVTIAKLYHHLNNIT